MKLLTHNFLTSKMMKGVKVGYPLILNVAQKEIKSVDFNAEFLTRMLPRLDWGAIRSVAEQVGAEDGIPQEMSEEITEDLLQKLHHLLLEIEIIEGELKCPETGRVFPITNGIPNMLLTEYET